MPSQVDDPEPSHASDPTYGDHLLFRNDGVEPVVFTVVQRRGGEVAYHTVHADPETTSHVGLSGGHGASRLEVHCEGATATVRATPGSHPPLFTYHDGIVLVDY